MTTITREKAERTVHTGTSNAAIKATQERLNEDLVDAVLLAPWSGVKANVRGMEQAFRDGADVNGRVGGVTVMEYAATIGREESVDFLHQNGARVTARSIDQARKNGHEELADKLEAIRSRQIVEQEATGVWSVLRE
jgi:hypothetical protein